ncbi:MAG: glutaredoxin domain-containing protein [Candidatus Dormibacteria bacterium]
MQPEVTIYTTPTCTYCAAAKRWFADHGVAYAEFDISRDQARAAEVYRLTGQGSVPVIRVGGQMMVGYDPLQLARLLPDSLLQADAGRGMSLGMAAASLTAEMAAEVGLPAPFGVVVGNIRPGGPAAEAGLRQGDVLVGIGAYTLQNLKQLQSVVALRKPGESITFRVWRDGAEIEATVTFPVETTAPPRTPVN